MHVVTQRMSQILVPLMFFFYFFSTNTSWATSTFERNVTVEKQDTIALCSCVYVACEISLLVDMTKHGERKESSHPLLSVHARLLCSQT